uniref:Receptor ligand binding region domain-containing protein n=1 Tax=Panagrolaimus superbus TaxID=310955 RepID=A0A914Z4R3_9BILA
MFPIAFIKNVYTDYYIMEQELATTYAPQNFYCFSIDSKASDIFRKQIHALSSCFPNVFYAKREFPLDSAGHYNSYAQFECLKILIKYHWKYVILLLSHDIAIKTNAEIVQILTWFDGTNDMMIIPVNPERVNLNYTWTFEELRIFKNGKHIFFL